MPGVAKRPRETYDIRWKEIRKKQNRRKYLKQKENNKLKIECPRKVGAPMP